MLYPGRIWIDDKVISFWVYPDEKNFKKIIKDLSEYFYDKVIDIANDPDWKVEIVRYNGKIANDFGTPEKNVWNNIYNEDYVRDLIPVSEYKGSLSHSKEELEQEHILSPLLKKQKNVPIGFGSKHPDAEKKFKEKIDAPFESYYPRMNESPDTIYFNEESFKYSKSGAIPFTVTMNGANEMLGVLTGEPNQSHSDAGIYYNADRKLHQEYEGRVFVNQKVLTFWIYPNMKDLITIIRFLEDKLSIKIIRNNWFIEIDNDDEDSDDYEIFIPLDEYIKNNIQSKNASQEDWLEHLKSPLLKKDKQVPFGFGSKHPKAEQKFKEKMDAPFESTE